MNNKSLYLLIVSILLLILNKPVEFFEMATLDKIVHAEIIFLLSIIDPSDQVIWLQRLVTRFQTEGFLKQLRAVPDDQACYELLYTELGKEDV
jgi:mannitol/fructose-specific phosphotransferase system IIA component (Ntr-type)